MLTTVSLPSSPPPFPLPSTPCPIDSSSISIQKRAGKPPMDLKKAWHIKLGYN